MGLTDVVHIPGAQQRRRFDLDTGALVGSRCEACGAVSWPMRAICHRCGQPAMRESAFARTGKLITFTTVWIGPETLNPPYTLGQVRIDDGPLMFGHVRALPKDAKAPMRVRLKLSPDPSDTPPFWFIPEEAP